MKAPEEHPLQDLLFLKLSHLQFLIFHLYHILKYSSLLSHLQILGQEYIRQQLNYIPEHSP